MPSIEKISIALPTEMVAQIREAVRDGEYASSSEAVRDALRAWHHKRQLESSGVAELRKMWQEARRDKRSAVDPEAVLGAMERRFQAMIDSGGAATTSVAKAK